MFRTAFLILSGNVFNALALFLRNLLIARLLSVKDYGIASTFSISMAIVEMMTSLGLHQMIVQSKDGNDPAFQAALQGFNLLRSLVSSLALFLLAAPIARFLDVEEVIWAYQLLAIVPLLNGAMHFDVHRLKRQLFFLPSVMTFALSAAISIIVIWPLYKIFGDYRVMLYAMLTQQVTALILSHTFAKRAYAVRFDRGVVSSAFQFGWPLWIDTILLFAIFNGEKLIVGHELNIEVLAVFTLGFSLTMAPTLIVNRSAQSFFLPQLSATREDKNRFIHLTATTLQTYLASGSIAALAIYFLGGPFITYLFGEKYLSVIPLLPLLAVFQSIRAFKGAVSTIALSIGRTKIPMVTNFIRVGFLPFAWYVVVLNNSLYSLVLIGIIGELASFVAGLIILSRHVEFTVRAAVLPAALILSMFALIGASNVLNLSNASYSPEILGRSGLILALFFISLATMTDLQQFLRKRVVSRFDG